VAAMRQAYDVLLMSRTRSPTGRLQHNHDGCNGRLAIPIDAVWQPLR
jgi:hypothetical protein